MPDPATLLVHGRAVLTGRLDRPEVPDGAVAVRGPLIAEVGAYRELRARYPEARELGGDDRIVLPGLVSAHQHGAGASSVQLGVPDGPFERWLIDMLRLPPLDVRQDTRYHALRLLENGITATLHSHYVRDPRRYLGEVADILAGYADVGVRVAFAPHYIDRNFLTYGDDGPFLASLPADLHDIAVEFARPPIEPDAYLEVVQRLDAEADPARRRILFGPVAPQWCSEDMLRALGELVRGGARGAHLHLLETAEQRAYLDRSVGDSVVAWLDAVGLVGPSTSFAHGVWLRTDEIALLAERGATIVLNPGCNLRLGNGIAPLGEIVDSGVDLAVGTDDMTLGDDDDLFSELRLVSALARVGGTWIDPAVLLRAATWGGARAAQLADLVGTLETGKRADVVLLDAGRIVEPAVADGVSILELTIARAQRTDVRTVLVDGEVVLDDGVHRDVDRSAVIEVVRASAAEQTATLDHSSLVQAVARLAAARAAYAPSAVPARRAGSASDAKNAAT